MAVSLICSGEIVDLKIMQSDWLRALWSITQKQDLSEIWELCKTTTNSLAITREFMVNAVKRLWQISK